MPSYMVSVKEHTSSEQHINAIKLDTAEKLKDKESEQLIQKNNGHIVRILKIVYTLIRQDIPLSKLPYFVQLSRELESPFIIDGQITYENKVSGREFAFAISNIIKAKIWKEIGEAVSFNIMIDKIHILQEYQRILDCPEIHLKKLKEIRWLGWYEAVENFVKTLPAILSQLQSNDSQLVSLNKFFQKRNLYFRNIIPMIDATITSIQKDYIIDSNLGYHLQVFIDHTNPFNN
ncbi:21049_t:CDS:2, partial [Racocetra persica]